MSKSLGNVILVSDILNTVNPIVVRIALMSAHYRQPLNWTKDTINYSRNIYEKIISSLRTDDSTKMEKDDKFFEYLCDDLNTPNAIQHVIKQAREAKKDLSLLPKLRYNCNLIGIKSSEMFIEESVKDKIENLVEQRELARKNKDYMEADRIRDALSEMKVVLNDDPSGVTWKIRH